MAPSRRTRRAAPVADRRSASRPGKAARAPLAAAVGNRAARRALQGKLTLGPAGDRYEQEADRVARQVMASIDTLPAVAAAPRRPREEGQSEEELAEGQGSSGRELVHRACTGCADPGEDVIRRLSITPTKSFTKGSCGLRSIYWNFKSGVAAPKGGGYIVQHVQSHEDVQDCPSDVDATPAKPNFQFWEAWWVAEGDQIQEKHKLGIVDFTDRSARPGAPGKSGVQVSRGEVRFFAKSTTGDLGKENVLSSDAKIASVWKPGTKGGVRMAGWLPSTTTQPAWWGKSLDGPAYRWANSWWNCCGEESKHWSKSDADPK